MHWSTTLGVGLVYALLLAVPADATHVLRTPSAVLPDVYLHRPQEPGRIPVRLAIPSQAPITVAIMGYANQPNLLAAACHHALMTDLVAKVLLIWNSQTEQLHTEKAPCNGDANAIQKIQVLPQQHNTLLNRYTIYPHVSTDAVLLLDDDVVIKDAQSLRNMFRTWVAHPQQIVGTHNRCVVRNWDVSRTETWVLGPFALKYGFPADCHGKYSITTGKVSMLHRNYLQMFMARQPHEILQHLFTEKPTCEDIALHFLVSNHTGLPPLLPKGVQEQDLKRGFGMYDDTEKKKNVGPALWTFKRSVCVNKFVRLYGKLPLVDNIKI